MFRGDRLTKPKNQSFLGALLVAVLLGFGSNISSMVAYFIALLSLLMIGIASYTDSFWPNERKKENTIVFSLFWGCMLGFLLPILVTKFLNGGFLALYDLIHD